MNKIFKYTIYSLILYTLYKTIPFSIFLQNPYFFVYSGAFCSIILNVLGTSSGMLSISNTCAGTAILFPKISSKSLIGIIICETNLLCGIIMAYLIIQSNTSIPLQSGHLLFSSGLLTGACGYASSMATGLICAAVNVMDAKHPGLFPKLVFFEFVAGSIGVLGLAIGFLVKEKAKIFT